MKIRKNITRLIIIALIALVTIGTTISMAVGTSTKNLSLSLFRYSNGTSTNGYALAKTGHNEKYHPVYQIYDNDHKTYYCLNAGAGTTWNSMESGGTSATVEYNRSYDLDIEEDINSLKNLTDGENDKIYKNVATSQYLPQILWILNNIYIPTGNKEQDAEQKRALLEKAGLEYVCPSDETPNFECYRYKQNGTYWSKLDRGKTGYYYEKEDETFVAVELDDDLVEVAQQAALWYYTNYKDNNPSNTETYNVAEMGLALKCSNGISNTTTTSWQDLSGDDFDVNEGDYQYEVGKWKQEQAAILCSYLIDAAEANKNQAKNTTPLQISSTTGIVNKTVDNTQYYVVGPITISKINETLYTLSNDITVNGSTSTGAYIATSTGAKDAKPNVKDHIGTAFYVAVPKNKVNSNSIKIGFSGQYTKNKKTLWTNATKGEQPIVEVTPQNQPFDLEVTATTERNFDLALRKTITKLVDAKGNGKFIINEDNKPAARDIKIVSADIATNKTATYNHRKDPVVVKIGDEIIYNITIYNEGDIDGYASKIVDQLPTGLTTKLKTGDKITSSKGNEYTVTYDTTSNKIELNITKENAKNITAFNGTTLDSEEIEVTCEVTSEATKSEKTNNYLTNIAYISEAYNSSGEKVDQDRNNTESRPSQSPTQDKDTLNSTDVDSYKGNTGNQSVREDTTNNYYYKGEEDDDDFEKVVVRPAQFDLALQKYISSIYSNGTTKQGRQEPTIDTTKLASGESTTAEYKQDKSYVPVKNGDFVTYTITVYNEGEVDGYVDKITDNIPVGLQFAYQKQPADGKTLTLCNADGTSEDIEVDEEAYKLVEENNSFWSLDKDKTNQETLAKDTYNGESTISITCDVAKYLNNNKLLTAYDSTLDTNHDGKAGLASVSVTVVLRVGAQNGTGKIIRNEAAITEAEDSNHNKQDVENGITDRDSKVTEWPGKDGDKKYQDDEDYDNVILGTVDLALTKFITAVSNDINIEDGEYITADGKIGSKENPYLRATGVNTAELKNNPECHDATYYTVKDPIVVPAQSYVLYNIRVYNEGEVDVYAGKVTDHLPDYLDYVECDFNKDYGWNVGSDGKTIWTEHLSNTNGTDKLMKAFDKEKDDEAGSGLDYKDLQILCKVNDKAPTNKNLVNVAEITEYEDENGDTIPNDVDSTPDNVDQNNEDDDDYEQVVIKTFDLSLLKYVSTVYVTEDGKTKTTQTGNTGNDETDIIPKVEINRKKINSTVVKFGYTIKITNEGDIAGYAKEITDYVPEGLKFYSEDNQGWTDEGNNVISTRLLENTLLQPGESAQVTVIFRWINGSTNLGLKTNTAEISEDYNEEGVPDRDSTPDNKVKTEDDIDDAQVLLSIATGLGIYIIKYVSVGLVILMVLGTGIIAIKKFVL